jgi:hypothetical protein
VTGMAIKFYSFSGNSNNVSMCVKAHLENFVNFILARSFLKEVQHDISLVHEHIIRTLLYYDIFNYPLKAEEVFRFLAMSHTDQRFVRNELEHLANQQFIYRFGDFFSIQNNEDNIVRRMKGNQEAERYLGMARRQAKLIARFPFVRAVLASGSLSKGYMDEKSDLDFFIITHPGRLWIARMLLVMYKRIFLFNSHKYFCVNYFVDSEHLEIEEKNLFTATELATVIPLYGAEHYHQLQESNRWLLNFFPNYKPRPSDQVPASRPGGVKKFMERLINVCGGNRFERYFMEMTLQRWMSVYGKQYGRQDFEIAFKTKGHASKNHPRHYQKKVITLYLQKVKEYNQKFNLSWEV